VKLQTAQEIEPEKFFFSRVNIDGRTVYLAVGAYYLTAVDTQGLESDPSIEYYCNEQWCIDRYLSGVVDPESSILRITQ